MRTGVRPGEGERGGKRLSNLQLGLINKHLIFICGTFFFWRRPVTALLCERPQERLAEVKYHSSRDGVSFSALHTQAAARRGAGEKEVFCSGGRGEAGASTSRAPGRRYRRGGSDKNTRCHCVRTQMLSTAGDVIHLPNPTSSHETSSIPGKRETDTKTRRVLQFCINDSFRCDLLVLFFFFFFFLVCPTDD